MVFATHRGDASCRSIAGNVRLVYLIKSTAQRVCGKLQAYTQQNAKLDKRDIPCEESTIFRATGRNNTHGVVRMDGLCGSAKYGRTPYCSHRFHEEYRQAHNYCGNSIQVSPQALPLSSSGCDSTGKIRAEDGPFTLNRCHLLRFK